MVASLLLTATEGAAEERRAPTTPQELAALRRPVRMAAGEASRRLASTSSNARDLSRQVLASCGHVYLYV